MMPYENTVKGENARNQHFVLSIQCFLPFERRKTSFDKQVNSRLRKFRIEASPSVCSCCKVVRLVLVIPPQNVFEGIQESACLSVLPSVY